MKYIEKFNNLMANEEFAQKMAMVESPEAMQQLLAEFGVEITLEEIKAMVAGVGANGELSDDQLDNVSGGGFFSWLFNKLWKKNTEDLRKLSEF